MNKPGFCVAVLMFAGLLSGPASAHESGIYESLEHIHIGRVFSSPSERMYLDKNRGVRATVVAGSGSRAAAVRNSNAAGYIVSSSGRARVWKDGDFVAAKIPDSIRFPGDVKVTRTADQAPAKTDATPVDDALPVTGAADDAD